MSLRHQRFHVVQSHLRSDLNLSTRSSTLRIHVSEKNGGEIMWLHMPHVVDFCSVGVGVGVRLIFCHLVCD